MYGKKSLEGIGKDEGMDEDEEGELPHWHPDKISRLTKRSLFVFMTFFFKILS